MVRATPRPQNQTHVSGNTRPRTNKGKDELLADSFNSLPSFWWEEASLCLSLVCRFARHKTMTAYWLPQECNGQELFCLGYKPCSTFQRTGKAHSAAEAAKCRWLTWLIGTCRLKSDVGGRDGSVGSSGDACCTGIIAPMGKAGCGHTHA